MSQENVCIVPSENIPKSPIKNLNIPLPTFNNNTELLKSISYVSKLIFPAYPSYYFPVFLLIEIIQVYQALVKMKRNDLKFYLKKMPNKLHDLMIESEVIKSEHIIFVSEDIFDTFLLNVNFNFLNLFLINSKNKTHENQFVKLLKWDNCDSNTIYLKENFFYNFLKLNEMFELPGNEKPSRSGAEKQYYGLLNDVPNTFNFPKVATKASISILNTAYELNTEIIDHICEKYFEVPRLVQRNYIYEIHLSENLIDLYNYSKYFGIMSRLKKIYFKINNLESKGSDYEFYGIIAKNFTNLTQTGQLLQMNNPQSRLMDLSFLSRIPAGLNKSYNELKMSIKPFLCDKHKGNLKNIYPLFMLNGDKGSGKNTIVNGLAYDLGMNIYSIDCNEIVSGVQSQTETKMKHVLSQAKLCQPLIICIHNFEIFGVDDDNHEDLRIIATFQSDIIELFSSPHEHSIIVIALFNNKQINPMIQRLFLEIVKITPPSKDERLSLIKWLLMHEFTINQISNEDDFPLITEDYINWDEFLVDPEKIFTNLVAVTNGFLFGDLKVLIKNSIKMMCMNDMEKISYELIEKVLKNLQINFADSLGTPKVPKVLWSDIGGLAKIKEEIQSSIGLPLKYINLIGKNMKRSGILLYGPPGTGKTLVAKAVATECNLNFLSVQGPELLNMYVGQSEQNVREIFDRARSAAPCVIFLDELDSLAPNRGASGDSGGVMDRVVSQLLAEMDGISFDADDSKQVFILAATNRPDLIDPALLRPGRFDKLFYVGPCTTIEDKLLVLKAITNKFNFDEKLQLEKVAKLLTNNWMTGADLYSICSNAWLNAVRRTILNDRMKKEAKKVVVNLDDFKGSISKFIPSISKTDLDYFNQLKSNYS